MKLSQLLDPVTLNNDIADGYIRTQVHPVFPYTIYNYTEKATFARHWTPATRACRGLIVNHVTEDILARPFPKFFNFDEPSAPNFHPADIVSVHDKLDGSLGIMYTTPDGPAIATRGSFTSPQAVHATALLRSKYPKFAPSPTITYLFEIVYPGNRIVLDYGQRDELILLGFVHNGSGRVHDAYSTSGWTTWQGPKAETLVPHTRFDSIPPSGFHRAGAEGIVILRFSDSAMIKIKQPDYVALHRVITHLSEKTVWRHLADNKPIVELQQSLPEEFWPWVDATAEKFQKLYASQLYTLELEFESILRDYDTSSRARFATVAKLSASPWAMFALYDGKDIAPMIWQRLEPKGVDNRPHVG